MGVGGQVHTLQIYHEGLCVQELGASTRVPATGMWRTVPQSLGGCASHSRGAFLSREIASNIPLQTQTYESRSRYTSHSLSG